ncbi:MAG: NAD(P)(+) transhydrogenase (Re/Si-specific) subunit beta [Rubricoccaceae bacterium]
MNTLITLAYLVASSLFILGLKRLSSPRTARQGNRMAAVGMLIALVAALLSEQILNPIELIAGLAIGGAIGLVLARRTEMTSMPELVAAFNGFGGAASALVAAAEVLRVIAERQLPIPMGVGGGVEYPPLIPPLEGVIAGVSILIGFVTLTGSFVAYAKLRGSIKTSGFPGLRVISVVAVLGVLVGFGLVIGIGSPSGVAYQSGLPMAGIALIALLALLLGVLLVLPIGGADMPVVVALLNAYSGLAAAATGFVLGNYALIISGALVGASGLILTQIMCVAMNRSLGNVLLGGFGADAGTSSTASGDGEDKPVRSTSPDDAAVMMAYAGRVAIVPGYGLAVAQAQHEVREMADLLQKEGVEVSYAIHPVAGRMPGHMNVLLAEANVPYDLLLEMDEINPDFPQVDVVLVVGANDVVNPGARDDPDSPIYGMPVLNVDEAGQVIVLKRSMNVGYAGIQNPLFFKPNTSMLFGDAKDSVKAIADELKALQPA